MKMIMLIYHEPQVSGQTTHVLSLARFLDLNRYRLIVVLPAHLQQCEAAFRQTGARVVLLPLHKFFWPISSIIALGRLIREERIDVVHIHSQEMGMTARPLARIAGARRIIYTPQTIDIRQVRWFRLYILIERFLAKFTDIIISVNNVDYLRLIQWGIPSCKVKMIPNGIDTNMANSNVNSDQIRRDLGVELGKPLVMQVGRLSDQKDPLSFIEGAARVLNELPEAQFLLVGEGPLKESIESKIQALGLVEKVLLAGWQPDASRLMPGADIVTLTSLWEGTPYSLLEAMASCKPVVTTSVNGCIEIVEDGVTGYIVPAKDPISWAERVTNLIMNPTLAIDMGQRGHERVVEKFSIQKMVNQLDNLY